MYKKLLLAVDGSDHSLRATDEAIKIASLSKDCSVNVVLVAEFSKAKRDVIHATGKEELEIVRRKKISSATDKLEKNNLDYTVEILHGEPGPTIVEYANKDNYDLLIIGSRGLNVFQEMVLGSVSHKVVKRANCPVMVVK
ncbi:universal stress protein [Pseudogracilibacillus sp. SO30301A]|uniref:universal stress protein n=1 Tax=Pseudogracilibacillus sp. SO30301A TaxID=3098291 RepID=UPI00300E36CF